MTRWSDDEVNPNTMYADAYDEGREAFDQGLLKSDCPYTISDAIIGWKDGWETQQSKRHPEPT